MPSAKTSSPISGLRILKISADQGTLMDDSCNRALVGCPEVTTATPSGAMELLRKHAFDVALVGHSEQLDAISYLPMLSAVGAENLGLVVVGSQSAVELEVRCLEVNADAYHCLIDSNAELLSWTIHRAVERKRLISDSRQWSTHQVKTRQEEHQAAIHQIRALRSILLAAAPHSQPPTWLVTQFSGLLRAYVVAVSGDLTEEVGQLVVGLQQSGVTLSEALMAHSVATEQLVLGLGVRPGWHVLGRSQMMAYELFMHFSLCDGSGDLIPVVDQAA